jgi:hypothetical protein
MDLKKKEKSKVNEMSNIGRSVNICKNPSVKLRPNPWSRKHMDLKLSAVENEPSSSL